MKKRDFYLFLSFVALFILFAIYQNFSFPTKQLKALTQKTLFEKRLHKFVPTYSFQDYIGGGIQAPYGYKEEIKRKIASQESPIVFDDKQFVRETLEAMPIYKEIKDFIDVASEDHEEACSNNPLEKENNCFTQYNSEASKVNSLKVKANPFRQTASISIPGDIESHMIYNGDRNSVNLQFRKELDRDAGIKFEIDSQEQSGSINIDVRW